ncbi:sulfatase-like hydrolase/transferase, partial [candidate division KSB1 bacterium]|nr:sulfatase-like hydrolase/transferase [candidate division KSB1 bacterium]
MQRRHFCKVLGLGTTAGLVSGSLFRCNTTRRRPNIVFILVDDLGWKDLGCYGSTFYETPNIDRLAAEGMRFTDAYAACPVCSPTRASIMTGKYPARLGLTDWIPGRFHNRGQEPANRLVPPEF